MGLFISAFAFLIVGILTLLETYRNHKKSNRGAKKRAKKTLWIYVVLALVCIIGSVAAIITMLGIDGRYVGNAPWIVLFTPFYALHILITLSILMSGSTRSLVSKFLVAIEFVCRLLFQILLALQLDHILTMPRVLLFIPVYVEMLAAPLLITIYNYAGRPFKETCPNLMLMIITFNAFILPATLKIVMNFDTPWCLSMIPTMLVAFAALVASSYFLFKYCCPGLTCQNSNKDMVDEKV